MVKQVWLSNSFQRLRLQHQNRGLNSSTSWLSSKFNRLFAKQAGFCYPVNKSIRRPFHFHAENTASCRLLQKKQQVWTKRFRRKPDEKVAQIRHGKGRIIAAWHRAVQHELLVKGTILYAVSKSSTNEPSMMLCRGRVTR